MQAGARVMILAALMLSACAAAGSEADPAMAALSERAEAGDAVAQFELAVRHSRGDGVAADPDAAGRWLVRAAEGGHVEARVALGVALLERATTPEEKQAALEWLQAAAEGGHMTAHMLLGGEAQVAGRTEEAVRHFAIVAEAGDAEVQYALGLIHFNGEDVPVDRLEALHWFQRAALQGHPGGQRGLGAVLANGNIGPVDLDAGYFWFTLAAAEDSAAADYVDALARELDPAQREALQAMARAWQPGEPGPAMRSAAGYADLNAGAINMGIEADAAPRGKEHLEFTAALATRRAPGYFRDAGALIELLLLPHELPGPAVWRWLSGDQPPPLPPGISLFVDAEGRPVGGMLRTSQGFVEIPASSIETDLYVRHDRIGGSLRRTQGDSGLPFDALEVRVLVELHGGR